MTVFVLALRVWLVALAVTTLSLRSAAAADEQRFALFVGNDLGGSETQRLLYAREDARRVKDVFLRLAAVKDSNTISLLGQDANAVRTALADLEARVQSARKVGARTALIVYYSGHVKDGDLRLGNSRMPLDELRARITKSAATLRLAIIDACRSGAVTRMKGARKTAAFAIETTSNAQTEGTVFLTSSSFDEDAQESDHLGGSYFSHHLINGLQGAADSTDDGKVTLAEAYAHAYAHTVASTSDSAAGTQHPTFSYELKGNGDFVLSEYARRNEGMFLAAHAPAGAYFLIDARGVVTAEIEKSPNQARRIAVTPGRYTVKRRLADRLRVGEIRIASNQLVTLNEADLKDAPFSDDPVKGASRDVDSRWSLSLGATTQSFFEKPTRESLFPPSGLLAVEVSVSDFLRHNWVAAFDLAVGGGNGAAEHFSSSVPFRTNQLNLGASLWGQWPMFDGDLTLFGGARVAFMFLSREFQDEALPPQFFSTFSPGAVFGLRYELARRWQVIGRSRLHYLLYNVDENRSLGFVELTAALGYDF